MHVILDAELRGWVRLKMKIHGVSAEELYCACVAWKIGKATVTPRDGFEKCSVYEAQDGKRVIQGNQGT